MSGLIKMIKTEVSNQMKIERKTLKEEILREIRDDREKPEEIRKEREGQEKVNVSFYRGTVKNLKISMLPL